MNTFLPFPDYHTSAATLDTKRLGKQRIEVLQILNALHMIEKTPGVLSRWTYHPAVKMWRGYEPQLCEYGIQICEEWISHKYKDSVKRKIEQHLEWATDGSFTLESPPWLGDERFHRSHRSNLLRKDPSWYGPLFEKDLSSDLPYFWPV